MAGLLIFSCTRGVVLWICKKVEHLEANSVATRALEKLNLIDVFGENLNCRNGVVEVNRHVEHVRNPPGENLANTPHRSRTQIARFAIKEILPGVALQMF
jgi:hypothetical protein